MDQFEERPARSPSDGLPKSKPIYGHELAAAAFAVVGEILARAQAYMILQRLDIQPGPDPVQQVIDLARDVRELLGENPD